MTLVHAPGLDGSGAPTGPGVHALVLGVACYPSAKRGLGSLPILQNVRDLPSAANSAMMVVDWLIEHEDAFGVPLASIELLLNGHQASGYAVRHALPPSIDEPDRANVFRAGEAWVDRCRARPGSVALFFGCGHGAIDGDDTTMFLSDLNADRTAPWSKLNVRETARAFKFERNVTAAHFFVDACQEFIAAYQLARTGVGARFTDEQDPFAPPGEEKVTLLTAAAPGSLAYEGYASDDPASEPRVKAGRFTLTVLVALSGAAARDLTGGGDWVVHAGAIFEDLKSLYRLRPDWRDLPFNPTPRELPNEVIPIVSCATSPRVPILVKTEPGHVIASLSLSVVAGTRTAPALTACTPADRTDWTVWVRASLDGHWLVAVDAEDARYEKAFTPVRSSFALLLRIPR